MRSNQKVLLLLLVIVLIIAAGCSSGEVDNAEEPDNGNQGDMDQAKAEDIALAHANVDRVAVTSLTTKLDNYGGTEVYEIKFVYNDREYEYKIHAQTGEIVEAESDN